MCHHLCRPKQFCSLRPDFNNKKHQETTQQHLDNYKDNTWAPLGTTWTPLGTTLKLHLEHLGSILELHGQHFSTWVSLSCQLVSLGCQLGVTWQSLGCHLSDFLVTIGGVYLCPVGNIWPFFLYFHTDEIPRSAIIIKSGLIVTWRAGDVEANFCHWRCCCLTRSDSDSDAGDGDQDHGVADGDADADDVDDAVEDDVDDDDDEENEESFRNELMYFSCLL